MPPSPRIRLQINQERYEDLCMSMGLKGFPRVVFAQDPRNRSERIRFHGSFHRSTCTIQISTNISQFERDRLRSVASDLTFTLLHELRHAWQYENWSPDRIDRANKQPYHDRETENDANAFATSNQSKWLGIVRPGRVSQPSRFSQLGSSVSRRTV